MRQWLMCRGAFKQRSCILQCESMVGTFFFVTLRAFSWPPHFQESDGCALWEKNLPESL